MNEGFSPHPRPRCFRILIAENNFSTVESLLNTFGDRRLDIDFDLCTSHNSAWLKILRSPYQLIISGVHLAEIDDFYLLRHNQKVQPSVPLVVIANASAQSDRVSARRVLEHGAFDLIPTPLDHEHTVNTICLALWHNQLLTLIACKEKAVEKYRQHVAAYPNRTELDGIFSKTLTAIEKSIACLEQSIFTTQRFGELAMTVENQARKRALERLDSPYGPPR